MTDPSPRTGPGTYRQRVPVLVSRLSAAVAALLLATGLSGCGGDAPERSPSAGANSQSSAETTSESASESSAGSASERTSESSSANTGGQLAGEGYAFALPDGWQDATEQFQEYSELIDAGAINAEQAGQGFSDNVNVLRNADQAELPRAAAEQQFADELRTVASRVEVEPQATVDGVAAVHLTGRTKAGEVTALTDQYICFVEGTYYVVTFSYGAGTPAPQRERERSAMLDSWTWD